MAAIVAGGCGGPAKSESPEDPGLARLTLEGPAPRLGHVPARYPCSERSIWFPLRWSAVPSGTRELILVSSVSRLPRPSEGQHSKLLGITLIGGLSSRLRSLSVGPLPAGAYLKMHSPICRRRDKRHGVVFVLYAMATRQPLRKIGEPQLTTLKDIRASALAVGSLPVVYGGWRR
jgi:hypothetical protein